jgi:hypothetical protein
MTSDEVANSKQYDTEPSEVGTNVAVVIAAILATQFITGGFNAAPFTWLHLPALASIVYALTLHLGHRRPSIQSPTARAFVRGYMLMILALSVLVVGARLGFPIASFADAPNNQMHRVLRGIVALPCSILALITLFVPILSHAVRTSPIFWLASALNLILISSTAIRLRHLPFL